MNLFGMLEVSGSALGAERWRAEVVAANMANAETTRTRAGRGLPAADAGVPGPAHAAFSAAAGGIAAGGSGWRGAGGAGGGGYVAACRGVMSRGIRMRMRPGM